MALAKEVLREHEPRIDEDHDASHGTSVTGKAIALTEVVIVKFVVFSLLTLGLLQFMYGTVDPTPLPLEAYYVVGMLWFAIPAVMIFGLRRSRREYGLSFDKAPQSLALSLSAFPLFLLASAGFMIIMMFGWSYLEPAGALVLTGFFAIALLLIVRMIAKKYSNFEGAQISRKKHQTNLLVVLALLLVPILLGLALGQLSVLLVSTVVWQFIFSGFGEEIFFRGYVQSRLNIAFGRPYEWKGIRFGLGLIITAALFAITHILNTANIWFGDFNLAWWWGTFTFVAGLLFGLLREKTHSVVAPGILHGFDAFGEAIALLF